MERRGQTRTRQSFARRLGSLSALALMAVVFLAACGDDKSPYSSITPRSSIADEVQGIYKLVFWLALVIFVGVQAAIVYTVMKFRRRREGEARPPQTHGNKTLEILWTMIPAVILLVIFIPTVRTMYNQADEAQSGEYVIEVYGKQWWWEIHYKEPATVATVITANEIRIPVGVPVQIHLFSNNVIHSFWIPQLSGKMDVMPGHENVLGFTAESEGRYFGECAEFCGESHAWMRFQVVVESQENFDSWIAAYNAGPQGEAAQWGTDPKTGLLKTPPSFGLCIGCHRVNGTTANVASVGLNQQAGTADAPGTARTAGPNLSLIGCRTTLAAGMLANDSDNLYLWLHNPGGIKQGNHMASVITEGLLSDEQIAELTVYLESLVPAGGCLALPADAEKVDILDATPIAASS